MDKELLRLIMQYEFWNSNKEYIIPEFFGTQLQEIFKLIANTHIRHQRDLSITEVKELYYAENPAITLASKNAIDELLNSLPNEISNEIASEIIQKAWFRERGRQLAQIGVDCINEGTLDTEKARKIIEAIETGRVYQSDELVAASNELEDILGAINVTTKYHFNIPSLATVCNGCGPGIFSIIFARPEVGKTTFSISLCASPGGFVTQGALVNYYCNEEPVQRVQGRAVMAFTGMSLQEILFSPDKAKEIYHKIKDQIKFYDCKGISISKTFKHIKNTKPDIVVFDQLDKLEIDGSFARNDERLGALYQTGRDIAAITDSAVFAVSQANAQAEGKTYLSSVNMAEALTRKAAEADLAIGIGKMPEHEDLGRVLNIVKNKITGNHNQVLCRIQPEISRFIA